MSLLDDIKSETRKTGTPCSVAVALASLDNKQDVADLKTALTDSSIPATSIARALTKRGLVNFKNGDAITRHRRGDCRCDTR